MPISEGYRYCLTCVDWFSIWPEAISISDQEAATVARAFYSNWITRFGTSLRLTTVQGRQFESHLFKQLNELTGTVHFRTTSYHPAANGMVERFHRQVKAAIKCHGNQKWTEILPSVLMGIRAAWKEDLKATVAEMVYGENIRLPADFLSAAEGNHQTEEEFVQNLRKQAENLRPVDGTRHGERKIFVFKDLPTSEHVFVRYDGVKTGLQNPYEGPFKVISRGPKTFIIKIKDKDVAVSIERLKPAYTLADNIQENTYEQNNLYNHSIPVSNSDRQHPPHELRTRSGRTVRFPDFFQAGFS